MDESLSPLSGSATYRLYYWPSIPGQGAFVRLVLENAGVKHVDAAHQMALTLADLVAEAHDTHHPVSVADHYEDQRPEAPRRAKSFVEARIPKFTRHLERCIER